MNVTWDPNKAKTNLKKHRVSLSDAEAVLFDPMLFPVKMKMPKVNNAISQSA